MQFLDFFVAHYAIPIRGQNPQILANTWRVFGETPDTGSPNMRDMVTPDTANLIYQAKAYSQAKIKGSYSSARRSCSLSLEVARLFAGRPSPQETCPPLAHRNPHSVQAGKLIAEALRSPC